MANKNGEKVELPFTQDIEQRERGERMKNAADQQYLDFIEHRDNYQYFP